MRRSVGFGVGCVFGVAGLGLGQEEVKPVVRAEHLRRSGGVVALFPGRRQGSRVSLCLCPGLVYFCLVGAKGMRTAGGTVGTPVTRSC